MTEEAATMEARSARVGARSDTGRRREHNEDRFLVRMSGEDAGQEVFDLSAGLLILAVADGMGGAVAGEVASALAVDTLEERTEALAGAPPTETALDAWLVDGVMEANDRVLLQAQEDPDLAGMGSTLTVVGLVGPRLSLAHIGDSRAYHWRAGVLRRVSEDQTWVGQLVATGSLTEAEARQDPRRHIILQALGTAEDPEVYRAELALQAGDRILLCSDGLTELLVDKEVQEVLESDGPPSQQCELLVHWANHRGGVDNITVVIAHLS